MILEYLEFATHKLETNNPGQRSRNEWNRIAHRGSGSGAAVSALRGCGIDNAYIDVDNLEVPIMDGSAEAFAEMIESAGIVEQSTARRALMVRETVGVESGNRRISIEPAAAFEIDCIIDFPHPLIGVQHRSITLDNGSFARDIASARTFGFVEEVEALRRANLIQGGSLDNAIVLTKHGMLNENGLRFPDEFVRHKILDIIGDFALLGMVLLGRVKAERSGHLLHAALMSSLLRNRAAWEIVDLPAKTERNETESRTPLPIRHSAQPSAKIKST